MESGYPCWQILGIAPTSDTAAIRRVYARLLKQTRPEDDAEGFARLRDAYEWAMHLAQYPDEYEAGGESDPVVTAAAEPGAGGPEGTERTLDVAAQTVFWRDVQVGTDPFQRASLLAIRQVLSDPAYPVDDLFAAAHRFGWLEPMPEALSGARSEWASIRHRLHEARACSVLHAMQSSESELGAIACFISAADDPYWQALDAREVLEAVLAEWLARFDALPVQLTSRVVEWANCADAEGYPRAGVHGWSAELCRRLRIEREWLRLQDVAAQPKDRVWLIQPRTGWARWWASQSAARCERIRHWLTGLEFSWPELFARLDAEQVAWWRQAGPPWTTVPRLLILVMTVLTIAAGAVFLQMSGLRETDGLPYFAVTPAMLILGLCGLYVCAALHRFWIRWLGNRASRWPAMDRLLSSGFRPATALCLWLILAPAVAALILFAGGLHVGWLETGATIALVGWSLQIVVRAWPDRVLPAWVRRAFWLGFRWGESLGTGVLVGALACFGALMGGVQRPPSQLAIFLCSTSLAILLRMVWFSRQQEPLVIERKAREPLSQEQLNQLGRGLGWVLLVAVWLFVSWLRK